MENLENIYIRLSDGLVMNPVYHESDNGGIIMNYNLYNYHASEEPPIIKEDLEKLGFVLLSDVLLTKDDIQTINYAEECLNDRLSIEIEDEEDYREPYDDIFRPCWEKLLKKLKLWNI